MNDRGPCPNGRHVYRISKSEPGFRGVAVLICTRCGKRVTGPQAGPR